MYVYVMFPVERLLCVLESSLYGQICCCLLSFYWFDILGYKLNLSVVCGIDSQNQLWPVYISTAMVYFFYLCFLFLFFFFYFWFGKVTLSSRRVLYKDINYEVMYRFCWWCWTKSTIWVFWIMDTSTVTYLLRGPSTKGA